MDNPIRSISLKPWTKDDLHLFTPSKPTHDYTYFPVYVGDYVRLYYHSVGHLGLVPSSVVRIVATHDLGKSRPWPVAISPPGSRKDEEGYLYAIDPYFCLKELSSGIVLPSLPVNPRDPISMIDAFLQEVAPLDDYR